MPLSVLKKRAQFLAIAAHNRKWATHGIVLQIAPKPATDTAPDLRYGLTASKRVGNAVARNRARRRLRALARELLPLHADPAHDYVLIAREATVTRAAPDLRRDILYALKKLGVWRAA